MRGEGHHTVMLFNYIPPQKISRKEARRFGRISKSVKHPLLLQSSGRRGGPHILIPLNYPYSTRNIFQQITKGVTPFYIDFFVPLKYNKFDYYNIVCYLPVQAQYNKIKEPKP